MGWWYTDKENEEELDSDWTLDHWITADVWIYNWPECHHVEEENDDEDLAGNECYDEPEYEECSGLMKYYDWCKVECGAWYIYDDSFDDEWVSCDEWHTWVECQ